MIRASLTVDHDFALADIDRRLFGTFIEHLGRGVYGGIYEPGHPTADANGFRGDVLDLVAELGTTITRYPGGNFLSGYNWEDGVGPVEQRPERLDLAWFATETNRFGTNEFIDWAKKAGVEPMFGVNLGTRGADDARRFVEYCNHPGGTVLSETRRAHGWDKPHDVKLWCLGNEMDGSWQIGAKTADEYGRLALETAKIMRCVDPSIELSACGSSNRNMESYGRWEYEVLDRCFDQVDYVSLHTYFTNPADSTEEFFANLEELDTFINEVSAIADAVAAKRRSPKRIMLSLDEWNVWYRARSHTDLRRPGWPKAPALLEEVYNAEDALLVGGGLITLLNNAARVKVACLAQLVNVIGPIMTENGGPAWRQTIFHPFALTARHAHGRVLRTIANSPTFATKSFPEAPYLLATVTEDESTGALVVFALNRHLTEPMELTVNMRGFSKGRTIETARRIHHPNLKAINTKDSPNVVVPVELPGVVLEDDVLTAKLAPASWNVIATRAPMP
jgi:alpha-L-arabinofuranosidase